MKKIGDVLKDFLREKGWLAGNPYEPLFLDWKRIAGEALAGHSRLVDVQNGILLKNLLHRFVFHPSKISVKGHSTHNQLQ